MVRAVTPIPFVKARFFDRCGKPLAGGKVYTYEANTTTPKVTYKDPYGLTPNTNPIILDAAGEADIYLDGTYRIRITDRNDVLINDVAKIGSWFSDNLQDSLDNVSSAMGEALKPTLQNLEDLVKNAELNANSELENLRNTINAAAAAGAGANGWTALLVADASGMTQQQVNDKTAIFYNTVADMVADTKLKAGKAVITHGYYSPNDGGGARYLIKDTATNYSIPVANGLHAVFADSFDIRKFGIVSSATQDQTTNLVRMRNYADTRVYTIDFLNFDIVVPNSNAGIYGRESVANGLWFEQAHHIKNLNITIDKSKRLETGKCCLIFCPTSNPSAIQEVVYENITLDCWNDNYQPFTENYLGAYDGMRHGIFIQPKDYRVFNPQLVNYTSNYVFKFINIKFKSQAYSYNITQAGVRSKQVIAENISGDCFLMINLDTINLYARKIDANVRFDKKESGRGMVMDSIHFEPEQTGKTGLTSDLVYIDKCTCMRTNTDGTQEKGQLLWITGLGSTYYNKIAINNSTGTASLQSSKATFDLLEVTNCKNGVWLSCNNTTINNVTVKNSVIQKYKNNPGYAPPFASVAINNLSFVDTRFDTDLLDEAGATKPVVQNVLLERCTAPNPTNYTALFSNMGWKNIIIRNCDFSKYIYVLRHCMAIDTLKIESSKLGKTVSEPPINIRYYDATQSTVTKVINSEIIGKIGQSGTLNYVNCYGDKVSLGILPEASDVQLGTNTLVTTYDNISSPELLQTFNVNQSVAANSSVIITKTVRDFCKGISLRWANDPNVSVSTAVFGTTAKITLTNNTASPVTVNSDVTLTQIV